MVLGHLKLTYCLPFIDQRNAQKTGPAVRLFVFFFFLAAVQRATGRKELPFIAEKFGPGLGNTANGNDIRIVGVWA